LEVGFFTINMNTWTTAEVTYTNFKDPVVFLSLPDVPGETAEDGASTSLRINNTKLTYVDESTSYFQFDAKSFNVNTSFCTLANDFYTVADLTLSPSLIGWLVVEKGMFSIENRGFIIGTGTITLANSDIKGDPTNHHTIHTPMCFGDVQCTIDVDAPNILTIAQIQTLRVNRYMLIRGISRSVTSVTYALQPHDSLDLNGYVVPPPGEDFAWILFERGVTISCIENLAIESYRYGLSSNKVSVTYANTFTEPPAIFGQIQTLNGRDSVGLRAFNLDVNGGDFITQEDKCAKEETIHVFAEQTSVLIIGRISTIGSTKCGATFNGTAAPSFSPTASPTTTPTSRPTAVPTASPTSSPTAAPTAEPSAVPTAVPSETPTMTPSFSPTASPTTTPTSEPTAVPTASPTSSPSAAPTAEPSAVPTAVPSETPTMTPSFSPTASPTTTPTSRTYRSAHGKPDE
jgi:hypothetical protein